MVTWRREDGNEIILKDSMGTKTHGNVNVIDLSKKKKKFPLSVSSFRGEVLKLNKLARNEMGSYLCIGKFFIRSQLAEFKVFYDVFHSQQLCSAVSFKANFPQYSL